MDSRLRGNDNFSAKKSPRITQGGNCPNTDDYGPTGVFIVSTNEAPAVFKTVCAAGRVV